MVAYYKLVCVSYAGMRVRVMNTVILRAIMSPINCIHSSNGLSQQHTGAEENQRNEL